MGTEYVYVHGFNSGSASRSGREIARLLSRDVFCPQIDYSRSFGECLESLRTRIGEKFSGGASLCVCGTSLGGFFAMQLRDKRIRQAIAWNPVIFPAVQLEEFLGENVRFTDGIKWHFGREALLSYAAAPDPRPWANWRDYSQDRENAIGEAPQRIVVLGDRDELLDARLSRAYWNGHARIMDISSAHQIRDFSHIRGIILK